MKLIATEQLVNFPNKMYFYLPSLLLSRMRDATLTKIRVDQLKLAQLGNLIDASFQSEHLRENSDLEVEFWDNWKGIRNNI